MSTEGCTINAAVVVYTHPFYVVVSFFPLHKIERKRHSVTLIMCTTNNSLVERAATSLESSLEKRLALVDVVCQILPYQYTLPHH